jgi:hypothetical protein
MKALLVRFRPDVGGGRPTQQANRSDCAGRVPGQVAIGRLWKTDGCRQVLEHADRGGAAES